MTAPKRFPDRDEIAAVLAEAEPLENGAQAETKRRLAGRVLARRDMGKLVFLDLVDRSGRIQLLCAVERTGEIDIHLGDIVGAVGSPAKSRRGEPSLAVDSLEVLARISTPLPDTFHGLTDVELRYRKRYLDLLMNEESRNEALLRSSAVATIRRILDEWGFVEVETPVLQPGYGGAFAKPFVTHYDALDEDRYLRIATELYLKRLIVGGLEKVYEIGKDFRNEDELRRRLQERDVDVSNDPTWSKLIDHAHSRFVEPSLVQPTILYDYPVELSPFARATDGDPSLVERFEYFAGGIELGNAFTETNDADEQAQRFAQQQSERAAGDAEAEEGDPDYVEALSYGMPPTSGIGLGIDRLAMLFTGKESIRDVILFPAQRRQQD